MATTIQPLVTTPGTADNLPQMAAKVNANFTGLANVVNNPGSSASTLAAGNDSRFDALTPAMVEPSGIVVGATDESTYIQAQLVAAAAANKQVVRLDMRQYAINPGVIQVPDNVTLDMGGGRAATARQVVNYGAGQAPRSATAGAQFVMLGGVNGTDTDPAYVTLSGTRSALVGASFFDPTNLSSLTTALPKPFAVRSTVYGATIERIELINAPRGIDVRGGRTTVRDITGNPLLLGVRADMGYDAPDISFCHFAPTFVGNLNDPSATTLATGFSNNSIGFQFLDNDRLTAHNLFCYGYNIGLDLAASTVSGRPASQHGSYGTISDSDFDGALIAVRDSCTQPYGMRLTDCGFTPFGHGNASRGYNAVVNKTGVTWIRGGHFWGEGDACAQISNGAVMITNSFFSGVHAYHIVVDGNSDITLTDNVSDSQGTVATIGTLAIGSIGTVVNHRILGTTIPATIINNASNVIYASSSAGYIIPPSSDPHVGGALWWNGTAFVRSAG